MPFGPLVQQIELSSELQGNDVAFINLGYQHLLGRAVNAEELQHHLCAFRDGMTYPGFVRELEELVRAAQRERVVDEFDGISEGEFIMAIYEAFEGRGDCAREVEHWRRLLAEKRHTRNEIVRMFMNSSLARQRTAQQYKWELDSTVIMGTDRRMTSKAPFSESPLIADHPLGA